MITEDYVSYEVAKLLKEKGFEGICDYAYSNKGNYFEIDRSNFDEVYCLRPTFQMVMKWLREVHGIFIAINNDDLDFNWQCYDLINRGSNLDPNILSESYAGYKTYEKAVEAALKYSLENLI